MREKEGDGGERENGNTITDRLNWEMCLRGRSERIRKRKRQRHIKGQRACSNNKEEKREGKRERVTECKGECEREINKQYQIEQRPYFSVCLQPHRTLRIHGSVPVRLAQFNY